MSLNSSGSLRSDLLLGKNPTALTGAAPGGKEESAQNSPTGVQQADTNTAATTSSRTVTQVEANDHFGAGIRRLDSHNICQQLLLDDSAAFGVDDEQGVRCQLQ